MTKNALRTSLMLVAGAAVLVTAATAGAQAPSAKCEAAKLKCANGYWTGLIGCTSKDSGKPDAVKLADCNAKSQVKWDGGADSTKGCFAKAEAKPPCLTTGDLGPIESQVQNAVTQLAILDPASTLSKCASGQKKCVSKLAKALLTCAGKNATKPDPVATAACYQKAEDKFTGGLDPAKGCFAKLENKVPNDCIATGLSADILEDTQQVADLLTTALQCGNGNVDAGEQCDDGNQVCGDACTDLCRVEQCGDGVQTCGESCDDGNTSNADTCPADCDIDACTPNVPSSQVATVSFNAPSTVSGISVVLDYPEGKVVVSGSGPLATGIFGLPAGTSFAPNDLDHALRLAITNNNTFGGFGTSGQLFKVDFLTCSGASAPVPGDFTCTVLGASGPAPGFADLTAGTTCSVTVP
jgi:cysteine-rich repeat protein